MKTMTSMAVLVVAAMMLVSCSSLVEGRALLNLGDLIDNLIDCPPPPAAVDAPAPEPYYSPPGDAVSPAPAAVYEPQYQSPPGPPYAPPYASGPVSEPSPEYQTPPAGGY